MAVKQADFKSYKGQREREKIMIMKKRRIVLSAVTLAVAVGLMLTACGSLKEAGEKLPASQEYVSADGAYKVIMPEGLTQTCQFRRGLP